jgi:hypothetical protein
MGVKRKTLAPTQSPRRSNDKAEKTSVYIKQEDDSDVDDSFYAGKEAEEGGENTGYTEQGDDDGVVIKTEEGGGNTEDTEQGDDDGVVVKTEEGEDGEEGKGADSNSSRTESENGIEEEMEDKSEEYRGEEVENDNIGKTTILSNHSFVSSPLFFLTRIKTNAPLSSGGNDDENDIDDEDVLAQSLPVSGPKGCRGVKKDGSGTPCKNPTQRSSNYCYSHRAQSLASGTGGE